MRGWGRVQLMHTTHSVFLQYPCAQDDAMMRDVILAIRADEAHHRVVNHTLSSMDQNESNPYQPGQ